MSVVTEKIEISGLPVGTLRTLEKIGHNNGKSAEEYARTIIEAELLSHQSFDDILRPVREDFAASGMTEDDFEALVESERQSLWEEKQHGKK